MCGKGGGIAGGGANVHPTSVLRQRGGVDESLGGRVFLATKLVVPEQVSPLLKYSDTSSRRTWVGRVKVGPASTLKGSSSVERKKELLVEPKVLKDCDGEIEIDLLPTDHAGVCAQYKDLYKLEDADDTYAFREAKISIQTRNVEKIKALYNEAKVNAAIGKNVAKNTKVQWLALATLVKGALVKSDDLPNYPAKSALLEILKEERGTIDSASQAGKEHLQQSILMEMGIGYGAWGDPESGSDMARIFVMPGADQAVNFDGAKDIIFSWIDSKVCESLLKLEDTAIGLNRISANYRAKKDVQKLSLSSVEINDWARVQHELQEVLSLLGKNPIPRGDIGEHDARLVCGSPESTRYISEIVNGNRTLDRKTKRGKIKKFFGISKNNLMEMLGLGYTGRAQSSGVLRCYSGVNLRDIILDKNFHGEGLFPGMWVLSNCLGLHTVSCEVGKVCVGNGSPQIQYMMAQWMLRGDGVVGKLEEGMSVNSAGTGDSVCRGVVKGSDLVNLFTSLEALFPATSEEFTGMPLSHRCANLLLDCAGLKRESLENIKGLPQCLSKVQKAIRGFSLGFSGDVGSRSKGEHKVLENAGKFGKWVRGALYGIDGEKGKKTVSGNVKQLAISEHFSGLLDAGFDGDSVAMFEAIRIALNCKGKSGVPRDYLLALSLVDESISQGMMFNRTFRESMQALIADNPHIFLFVNRGVFLNVWSGIVGLGYESGSWISNFVRRVAAWNGRLRVFFSLVRSLKSLIMRLRDEKALRDEYLVNKKGRVRSGKFYAKYLHEHGPTSATSPTNATSPTSAEAYSNEVCSAYANASQSMQKAYVVARGNVEERLDWIREQVAFFRCCENTEAANVIADAIDARIRNLDGTRRREVSAAEMRGYIEVGGFLLPEYIQVKNAPDSIGQLCREAYDVLEQVADEGGRLPSSAISCLRGAKLINIHRTLGTMKMTGCRRLKNIRYFVENLTLKRKHIERSLCTNIDWSSVLAGERRCGAFIPAAKGINGDVREVNVTDWLEVGWRTRTGVREIPRKKLYIEYREHGFPICAGAVVDCQIQLPISVTRELSEKMGLRGAQHSCFFAHIENLNMASDSDHFIVNATRNIPSPTLGESMDIEQKAFFASSHEEQKRYFTEVHRSLVADKPITEESLYVFLLALQQCPHWLEDPHPEGGWNYGEGGKVFVHIDRRLRGCYNGDRIKASTIGVNIENGGDFFLGGVDADEISSWYRNVSDKAGLVAQNFLDVVLMASDCSDSGEDSQSMEAFKMDEFVRD